MSSEQARASLLLKQRKRLSELFSSSVEGRSKDLERHIAEYAADDSISPKDIVNATKDARGRTMLSFAAAGGHVEVVKMLIGLGSLVQPLDEMGETPLMLAAASGHSDVVALLLGSGADPKAVAKDGGTTALHKACAGGHANVISLLISRRRSCRNWRWQQ